MGPRSARSLRDKEKNVEEPFYCAAVQNPENTICEGSDADESEGETIEKRRRYEHYARRYMDGHLPILQSARLRGSLSAEAGWINPWRYRQHGKQGWWKPGSEDMLFTKANVMKKAAENGLGYLKPAEALAWCKETAKAEANSISRGESRNGTEEKSIMASHGKNRIFGAFVEHNLRTLINDREQPTPLSDLLHTVIEIETQTTNTGQKITTQSSDLLDKSPRGTKRPGDAHWLKGTSITKHARWDVPRQPSPTPAPGIPGGKGARREPTMSTSKLPGERQPDSAPHSIAIPREVLPLNADMPRPDGKLQYRDVAARAVSLPSNFTQPERLGNNFRALEVLDDRNRRNIEGSPGRLYDPASRFYSSHTSDSLNTSSVRFSQLRTTSIVHISSIATPGSGLSGSSTISRQTDHLNHIVDKRANYNGDDSFTTEVAPSSGALEKFQYRKKRKLFHSGSMKHEALASNGSFNDLASGSFVRSPKSSTPEVESNTSTRVANGMDNETRASRLRSKDLYTKYDACDKNPQVLTQTCLRNIPQAANAVTKSNDGLLNNPELEKIHPIPALNSKTSGRRLSARQSPTDLSSVSSRPPAKSQIHQSSRDSIQVHHEPFPATSLTKDAQLEKTPRKSPDQAALSDSAEADAATMTPAQAVQIATAAMFELASQESSVERLDTISQASSNQPALKTQSPWMPSDHLTFGVATSDKILSTSSINASQDERKLLREGNNMLGVDDGWRTASSGPNQRPTTPVMDKIVPFKDLISPLASIRHQSPKLSFDDPIETQHLLDVATKNPWREKSILRPAAKPLKRVSFGDVLSSEKNTSSAQAPRISLISPPPPSTTQRNLEEEDKVQDKPRSTVDFRQRLSILKSFELSAQKKPETPIKSSPGIGAMAEAFLRADREAAGSRRSGLNKSPSRHLQPLKDALANVGTDNIPEDSQSSVRSNSPRKRRRTTKSIEADLYGIGDNLESIFDDLVGDVLEEWSVDTALKNVKAPARIESRKRSAVGIT